MHSILQYRVSSRRSVVVAVYYLLHCSLDVGRRSEQVELFETSSDCSDCAFCVHCFLSVYHKLHSKPIGFCSGTFIT